MRAIGGVLRIIDCLHLLALALGIVRHDELDRPQHGRHADGTVVQVLAGGSLEHGVVIQGVELGVTDHVDELADRLGRKAATAKSADGRHAGVVPSVDKAFLHEGKQLTLAHDGVSQVQTVELILAGAMVFKVVAFLQLVNEVVVKRTVRNELQRADRVCHPLEVITLPVREVIHRIGFPLRAGAMVLFVDDAVNDGVAEVHVGIGHVDLGTQDHGALRYFARVHLFEQREALLDRPVAERALHARLRRCPFLLGDLLARLFVNVCLAFLDEPYGKVPKLLEIVGGIIDVAPMETEPLDVLLDSFDVFRVLLLRICVVKTQIADTAILLRDTEVHADGFGMTDVEVAVWFWRETCLQTSVVFAGFQVGLYYLFDKVQTFLLFGCCNALIFHFLSIQFWSVKVLLFFCLFDFLDN